MKDEHVARVDLTANPLVSHGSIGGNFRDVKIFILMVLVSESVGAL
jgi:hypothetical protein